MFKNHSHTLYPCPFSKNYGISEKQAWLSLRVFFLYRLSLAGIFIIFNHHFFDIHIPNNQLNSLLYTQTSQWYLYLTLLSGLCSFWKKIAYTIQAQIVVFTDIMAITLLMHACGGVESGIGILLAASIASSSLLIGGRCSMVFAALATLVILAEQGYGIRTNNINPASYSTAGMLGASFFMITAISFLLAKRTEQFNQLSQQHYKTLSTLEALNQYTIEHLQAGIIIVNQQQQIYMANETALVLLDQSSTPQQLKDISLELSFLFANWLLYPTQQSLILPRKNLLPIQLQLNSLSINQDLFYTIILEDSSVYQQRLQQGVLAALGRLTASVAHEIRNPLNAISHAGQLLSENHQLNSQDARLLQIIQQHTERINKIINDILQSSKRHPTNQQRLYLSTWLKQYVAEFTHEQELSPNSFYLVVDYAELSALIDPGHLKQILDNLCHNALKYGQAQLAPIQIHLCLYQTHPCIELIDNGVIKDHHIMNQLFEPFFTTSNTGSGLGLYLSRELAHLNQASLHYAITSDQHSCFRLCLSNADKTQLTL